MRARRFGEEEAHQGEGQARAAPHDVIAVLPARPDSAQQLAQPLARQLIELRPGLAQQPARNRGNLSRLQASDS